MSKHVLLQIIFLSLGSRPLLIYDVHIGFKNCNGHFLKCMLRSIRNVKFYIKMRWNTMFITAVCVIFLIKLRRPKSKSLVVEHLLGFAKSLQLLTRGFYRLH